MTSGIQVVAPAASWLGDRAGGDPRGLTALTIGAAVFEIERLAQSGGKFDKVLIPVYGAETYGYDLKELARLIRNLLLFVLARDVELVFENRPYQGTLDAAEPQPEPHFQLCLFSGGVDSFVGVLLASERGRRTESLFCAHRDQARLIHIVRALAPRLSARGISMETVAVPGMGSHGYMQLRGFLYVLAAGTRLAATGADRLVVTECGPTMFQPRFSPVDAVTMTTHPVVLESGLRILELLLGRDLRISTPFANLTKAEIFALSPDPIGLRRTHSCISQRFGDHDGTCYGCVIRRLAATAAASADTRYKRNPLLDKRARGGNLLTLLAFSYDLLTKYSEMEDYEKELIEQFGKKALFRRFALDNLAAVHSLAKSGARLRSNVRRIYDFARDAVGTERLERRLKELQEKRFRPDWRLEVHR